MKKIVVVLETFEQGMDRREGGVIKMLAGTRAPAAQTEHGLQITTDLRVRTVPDALVEQWVGAGLVRIEDAPAT